jgi:hypothetical protein
MSSLANEVRIMGSAFPEFLGHSGECTIKPVHEYIVLRVYQSLICVIESMSIALLCMLWAEKKRPVSIAYLNC